jgi:predicted MFS family arabinose efflux permease
MIGAVGALAASIVGKIANKVRPFQIVLYAILIMLISWVIFYFGGYTYIGLIIGIILIDMGLQSMHIMNQSSFFALRLAAGNRLNTVYMFSYFIGGSLGTYLAAQAWRAWQWPGVVLVGTFFTVLVFISHLLYGKPKAVPEAS